MDPVLVDVWDDMKMVGSNQHRSMDLIDVDRSEDGRM